MPSHESFSNNSELSQILEISKPTPEQLIRARLRALNSINFLQKHTQVEDKEKQNFLIDFDIDKIWENWFEEPKKETYSKPEMKTKTEELGEKEKLQLYGNLSNLAYSEFKTIQNKQENYNTQNLQISWIKLDPLNYPNIKKIFTDKKPDNLNPDEEFLYNYVNNDKNKILINIFNNPTSVAWDVRDILRLAWFKSDINDINWNLKYALNDEYWVISDAWNGISVWNNTKGNEDSKKIKLLQNWFEALRKEKIKENWNVLESINWNFEILDYYPNETKNDKVNSWFWAICLKDKTTWEKVFAIRWTEIDDWWDLKADWKLLIKWIPENQTKDMIDFVERNITKWEKFNITGHSLGWALGQILSAMYKDNKQETYTFNSPGAKELKSNIEENDPYFAKFDKFEYNKSKKETWENITNVKATAWLTIIANLWEDIWDNEILLKNLWSHWIRDMIKYINNLDENSEELRKKIHEKPSAKNNIND
ncbi:MAG: Lipase family protein [uncultured bacterium (gcode 4)]|uniref:Lipase family protein n=1 Tax=uncultured bacterium (gcode 4) TaxID=1234023 RepID=K2BU82_9BACT|nr:MAG: Lipase family protein [uncultured bacterium (gcode 4)]